MSIFVNIFPKKNAIHAILTQVASCSTKQFSILNTDIIHQGRAGKPCPYGGGVC